VKRIEVEWIDSGGNFPWRTAEEAIREAREDDMACLTCGYLVEDNDRYLLVALNRQAKTTYRKEMVGDTIQIPKTAIQTIVDLGPKGTEKITVTTRKRTTRAKR
jgi:hypothetical protein